MADRALREYASRHKGLHDFSPALIREILKTSPLTQNLPVRHWSQEKVNRLLESAVFYGRLRKEKKGVYQRINIARSLKLETAPTLLQVSFHCMDTSTIAPAKILDHILVALSISLFEQRGVIVSSLSRMAKVLGTHERRLSNALHNAGFEFNYRTLYLLRKLSPQEEKQRIPFQDRIIKVETLTAEKKVPDHLLSRFSTPHPTLSNHSPDYNPSTIQDAIHKRHHHNSHLYTTHLVYHTTPPNHPDIPSLRPPLPASPMAIEPNSCIQGHSNIGIEAAGTALRSHPIDTGDTSLSGYPHNGGIPPSRDTHIRETHIPSFLGYTKE